jgi:hemolysin III
MRGRLHAYAFFVAIASGAVLCSLAATVAGRPGPVPLITCVIYAVTICLLFGTSALYHRRTWSPRGLAVMRRLDHSMIFVFIAGTYTPLSALLLRGRLAVVILAVVWGGAVLGVTMKLISPHGSRWVSAPLYILLGWVAVAVLPALLHTGGVAVLVLLVAGGVTYTAGAIVFAMRRPDPWPRVFGHHEIFHACTIIAAICHQVAIYFTIFAHA